MRPLRRIGIRTLRRVGGTGTLTVRFPDGERVTVGSGEPVADVAFADGRSIVHTVRGGITGFAEGYMAGRIETADLRALLRWAVANQESGFGHPLAKIATPSRRIWARIKPHLRHPRVRTMVDHYNLGNDFYAAWLDASLTYSSARFDGPDRTLEEAQRHKYETIARHAGLEPGMTVLEIGCGWGGFAEYAAGELGCRVVGLTVSEEQARFAETRIAGAGLGDLVDIRLQDFRRTTGTFDAVVSIEMIESIDEHQWPELFSAIARHLAPGGRAAVQAITIADPLWEQYRTKGDFIRQYIFPGGQLPAPHVLRRLATAAGLEVETVETFGLDYARTLAEWYARFDAAWPSLEGTNGLDERFRRMWALYLTLCEAGFRSRRIDVEQWVLRA